MGCIKSIIKKLIILALIICFFAFGGWTFVKQKINEYQNPTRETFVKEERNYADFSHVPGDFQLTRGFPFIGARKVSAKYLPTGQKIAIFDFRDEDKVSVSDFYSGKINEKIDALLGASKESVVTLQNFEVIAKGEYNVSGHRVPYIKFTSKVKNVPFKTVDGMLAAYSSMNYDKEGKMIANKSTKLVLSISDTNAFNPLVFSTFLTSLRF